MYRVLIAAQDHYCRLRYRKLWREVFNETPGCRYVKREARRQRQQFNVIP